MAPAAFESPFVACVMVGMFFALAKGWYSPEVVMFLALLLVWNVGILSNAEALSGFNNPSMLVVGALYLVVSAIEKSTLADQAARRILGLTTTFTIGFSRLMICALCMSAFTNNIPVTALLIPIVQDWARTRGFDPAVLLMPLSFVCAFGGILTTVGGGTNLLIQGMLFEAGKIDEKIQPFMLFEPAYMGLPLAFIGIVYLLFAAPRILGKPRNVGGSRLPARGCSKDLLTEVEVTEDFDLLGRPFALTLAVLGLPGQALLKVRRPVVNRGMSTPITRTSDTFDVSDSPETIIEGSDGLTWVRRLGEKALATVTVMSRVSALLPRRVLGEDPLGWRRRAWYHGFEEDGVENVTGKGSNDTVPCVEMAAVQVDEGTSATTGVRHRTASLNEATSTQVVGGGMMQYEEGDGKDADAIEEMYEIPPGATVRAGDVLVIGCDEEAMVRLHGSVASGGKAGLKVLGVSAPELPRYGKVFSKLVLSRSSKFMGRVARNDSAYFAASFECSVVSFRLKGGGVDLIGCSARGCPGYRSFYNRNSDRSLPSSGESDTAAEGFQGDCKAFFDDEVDTPTPLLSDSRAREADIMRVESQRGKSFDDRRRRGEEFEPGDTVLVLASEDFLDRASATRDDFLSSEEVGRLPEPMGWFHFFPLMAFVSMLAWNLATGVGMARASFAACAILILLGWVDAPRAVGCVNWRLLVLMGSALGFSKAIAESGLADQAGMAIRESGMSPSASLFVLCGFTMMCTELISNNAAAALNIPVALSMAREMKVDYKPFAMTVLISASCAFLTPIGTPTNVMVWGPGGYKFGEYAKLGGPLSLLFWVVASAAMPLVFPF